MVNANKIYALLGVPSQITPHLVTSPFFSPLVLGLIRLTLGVYALTTAIVILVHDTRGSKDASGSVQFCRAVSSLRVLTDTGDTRYFSYFTELTYIGLTSYFWASGVQTLSYALRLRRASDSFPLQSWPRFLQFLHILLYSTITTFRAYRNEIRLWPCSADAGHSDPRHHRLLGALSVRCDVQHRVFMCVPRRPFPCVLPLTDRR